jgi:uncharacterized protein (DUF433 family)
LRAGFHTISIVNKQVISVSPEILGGTPVFTGTRVPVQTFLEYIKAGESIDSFLEGFPSVKREQLIALLEQAESHILSTIQ